MSAAVHVRRKARLRTTLATATAAGLVLALTGAAPAAATAGGQVTATLILRTSDQAAVNTLARAGVLPKAERLARLAATMPSAQLMSTAEASATALGLTIDQTTPWTIEVHGSAAEVDALTASGSAAGAGVTDSPSLAPDVASVLSGGPTGIFHPRALAPLSGPDFRSAYSASSAPPTGATPPVIATIQFAGWNEQDLVAYAAANALPVPSASTFTALTVDADADPTAVSEASLEPTIDQESIYSVDPYAQQRAYFAENSQQGYIDALYAVARDAATGSGIMALSTSWGSCEPSEDLSLVAEEHTAIAAVVAAGVTVFAASGDAGSDDCMDNDGNPAPTNTVDYPASDPLVVGVGGTQLDLAGPVEVAWGEPGATPDDFLGSGGGQSAVFARPTYQAAVAPTSGWREVPDIAADAAGESGFPLIFQGESGVAYGTSLAAPISAALLTAELGSRGITNSGVGDIHGVLYSAPATSFRDVTSGTNGAYTAGAGYDMVTGLGAPNWHALVDQMLEVPTVTVPAYTKSKTIPVTVAAPGGQAFLSWVTGYGTPPACGTDVGHPTTPAPVVVPGNGTFTIYAEGYLGLQRCVIGTATTVVDTVAPTVVLGAKASPIGHHVTYSWAVADKGSGVASVSERLLRNGKQIWSGRSAGSATVTLQGALGSFDQLVVVAKDKVGNSTTAEHSLSIAFDDKSFHLAGGWSRLSSHAAFGGTLVRSAKTGAVAHISAYGNTFSLLTTTCSTCGIVGVYVDGEHVRDVSLYSRALRPQTLVKLDTFGIAALHSVVLVVRGTHAVASKGVAVTVDGLLAT